MYLCTRQLIPKLLFLAIYFTVRVAHAWLFGKRESL